MTLTALAPIAGLALSLVALTTWLINHRKHVRRGGPIDQRRDRLRVPLDKPVSEEAIAQRTRLQLWHDLLGGWPLRRAISRRARARAWLSRAMFRLESMSERERIDSQAYAQAMKRVDTVIPVLLHGPVVVLLNLALFLGDVVIVSLAVQAAARGKGNSLSPAESMVASLALSITLWLLGKAFGHALAKLTDRNGNTGRVHQLLAAGWFAAIVFAAVGLGMLRSSQQVVWMMLSMLPGLGSAVVAYLSASPSWRAVRAARSTWWGSQVRLAFISRAVARWDGRYEARAAAVALRLAATHALERSEAARVEILEPQVDVLAGAKSAEELEASLLRREVVVDLRSAETNGHNLVNAANGNGSGSGDPGSGIADHPAWERNGHRVVASPAVDRYRSGSAFLAELAPRLFGREDHEQADGEDRP